MTRDPLRERSTTEPGVYCSCGRRHAPTARVVQWHHPFVRRWQHALIRELRDAPWLSALTLHPDRWGNTGDLLFDLTGQWLAPTCHLNVHDRLAERMHGGAWKPTGAEERIAHQSVEMFVGVTGLPVLWLVERGLWGES